MNFDMPKAVFCGLALIAAAIFFGHGAKPTHAALGLDSGRYQLIVGNPYHALVIDTKTSEVRKVYGSLEGQPFRN